MLKRVVLKCPRCGSDKVIVERYIKCRDEKEWERIVHREVLMHDGFGWDLNTFEIRCARCNARIEEVSFEDVDKGDNMAKFVITITRENNEVHIKASKDDKPFNEAEFLVENKLDIISHVFWLISEMLGMK